MRRRRQPPPEDAIAHLLYIACVEIRSLAGRRPSHDPAESIPDIRAIADTCHNLPPCLGIATGADDVEPLAVNSGTSGEPPLLKDCLGAKEARQDRLRHADLDRLRDQSILNLKARGLLPGDYEGETELC